MSSNCSTILLRLLVPLAQMRTTVWYGSACLVAGRSHDMLSAAAAAAEMWQHGPAGMVPSIGLHCLCKEHASRVDFLSVPSLMYVQASNTGDTTEDL
jgi:hypothetical protein